MGRSGALVLSSVMVKEAISEPAGSTPKSPVTSPRREDGEQSVTGVCVVLDDDVCMSQTP